MAFKSFERAALWTGTGFCGIGAACFAVKAGATLLNHPEHTGELYGMATAAAIFAFLASQLREKLRDREHARNAVVGPEAPGPLSPGAPEWGTTHAPTGDVAP